MSDKSESRIPSELRISQKWDFAIENLVIKSTIGLCTAGLASVVLFRTRSPRIAFSMFGLGVGVGDAFRLSSIEFDKEKGK